MTDGRWSHHEGADRRTEVEDVSALVLGMAGASLGHAVSAFLLDAKVLPRVTDNNTVRGVDIVLSDGWQIRFTPEIIAPGDSA